MLVASPRKEARGLLPFLAEFPGSMEVVPFRVVEIELQAEKGFKFA